jgi:hypothetical protein
VTILALNKHCALFEMICTKIKSCSLCSSSMGLFMENQINKLKGQNPKINKQAGENKSEHRGQNVEN